jgi:hypothetical protein
MLTKLAKAFGLLRQDLTALKGDVQRLEKVRPIVKHGKDGVSPDPEEIVSAVLERIPAPKDGVSPDPQAIAEAAAKLVPAAKPGRDAIPPTVRDVADVVLAQIEKPKDGVSPDPQAIAAEAAKLIPAPKDGVSPTPESVAKKMPNPQRGKTGAPGKNGVSVTDVQLNDNELFVFLDGKKNSAGKIKLPAVTAPFRPGGEGGGGSTTPAVLSGREVLRGTSEIDQNPVAVDTPINVTFGAAQGGPSDSVSLTAGGVLQFNEEGLYWIRVSVQYGREGSSGTSWLYFRTLSSLDGINFFQTGRTALVKLENANADITAQNVIMSEPISGLYAKVELMRGSEGNNSGGLLVETPAEGSWGIAPSAEISIRKLEVN